MNKGVGIVFGLELFDKLEKRKAWFSRNVFSDYSTTGRNNLMKICIKLCNVAFGTIILIHGPRVPYRGEVLTPGTYFLLSYTMLRILSFTLFPLDAMFFTAFSFVQKVKKLHSKGVKEFLI